ncbi:Sister chromatid cohesion protein PDS5 homolog A [Linum perenne]
MADKLEEQLKELGSKLDTPPSSKDALVKLLKQAASYLSDMDQSPSPSMSESMQPFLTAIVKPELLKHQDRDVKLLVTTCICEITRITAPEAPYSDDVLKDIFQLIVSTFSGLSDTAAGPSFGRRVVILETVAKYRSCVVMLDLECDDLIKKMFSTFFAVTRDDHQENVLTSMQTIMVVLIEESEEVNDDLLLVILSVLGRNKSDVSKAARKLAMNIIEQCAVKLEAGIKQILVSLMSGDNRLSDFQIDYHEVIYDIYCCAPQILSGVVPYLTGELLTDQLDTRLKAVGLVGELFSLEGSTIIEAFQPIFLEFLKRLTDRVVEVRMSVLEHVKRCLLSNPLRTEASEMISALCERLLDFDENVRRQVVEVICNVAIHAPGSVPAETIKLVADRLRDKSLTVKKHTVERIAEIFRAYCKKSSDSSIISREYEWVPGKILRCFYDKDFRSDAIEYILSVSLFPSDLLVKDRVVLWVRIFATFDKVEVKALEKLLEQKLRLQQEMQRYMSLRSMHQEGDAPEIQKKILFCFRIMSRSFADPAKAEENFLVLDQLKDAKIWKILVALLDVNTSLQQACTYREDLLKVLGEKHRLYDFLSSLSVKCSYLLFSKEYVKEFLSEAISHKSSGNSELIQSSMDILVILARFGPLLFGGAEEELISFLKDDNEILKEGALHVLAKAGGIIREQLAVSSSSIDLILERLCLEGSRRQAKYAVHALAAITKDDGLKSLSVLYKKLVGMLEEKRNLPAVLQSLGCIAQTATSVFETRETEIQEFVKGGILNCKSQLGDNTKLCWDDVSETSLLKIYGLKVFVKSHLPIKDVHLRPGIGDLLDILRNLLNVETSQGIESSLVDKAHLRLAAAKAVLRLSKHWDHKIPIDIFHLTLRVAASAFPEARKIFLAKVHQYIKDRLLDPKYACAFLFYPIKSEQLDFEEEKQNLVDIIQMHCQSKARQVSLQSDASPSTAFPESILPYVVHSLAHISCPDIDECKDVKAYEPIYRQLYLFLSLLMHKEEEVKVEADTSAKESISMMMSVFQAIKGSEDIMERTKSKNSRAVSELGLSIVKRLAPKEDDLQMLASPVTLPSVLYKPYEKKEDDSVANEEKTWLAEESVITHFQSLNLETNIVQKAPPTTAEEEYRKDSDIEENEEPLGEMLKQLKAKSTKAGRNKKEKPSSAKGKSTENDFDILKMVREINVNDVAVPGKFEASNGHKDAPIGKLKSELEHGKGEKRKAIDVASVPVPKRRRSASIYTAARLSQSPMKAPSRASAEDPSPDFGSKGSFPRKMGRSGGSDFLVSCVRKSRNSVPKKEFKRFDLDGNGSENEAKESDEENLTSPSLHTKNDKNNRKHVAKPLTGSGTKRKRQGVSEARKVAKKDGGIDMEELIGNRIKVWWPMDKEFYAGTVKSYDPLKGKHVILYDDGDIEVLRLDRERWELIDKGRKHIKKLNSSKRAPPKQGSTTPKKRSKGGSQQNKSSTKIVKGKRTQKKVSQLVQKEPEDDELSMPSDGEETKSDDSQVEREEEETQTLTKDAESDKEDTSTSGGKHLEDEANNSDHSEDDGEGEPSSKVKDSDNESEKQESEKSDADEESHSEEEKEDQSDEGTLEEAGDGDDSGSEENEDADDAEEDETGPKESSSPVAMDLDAEIPDDEPLSKWKDKVGKKAVSKRAR